MKRHEKIIDHFGGCEGPLGFPMKDATAKQVEQLLAGLDGDCRSYLDAHGGIARVAKAPETMELRPAAREEVSLITTEALDLDREVILADGLEWGYFEANGKNVTWAHHYDMLPIGKGLWFKTGEGPSGVRGVLGATQYAKRPDWWPEGQVWFADAVAHYVFELGQLRGRSIGFVPTAIRKPTAKDVEGRPELEECNWIIARAVALEWAVCVVQCNPDAVRFDVEKARALGIATPELMLKAFGIEAPPAEPAKPEPPKPKARPTPAAPKPEPAVEVVTMGEARRLVSAAVAAASHDIPELIGDAIARARGRV